MLEGSDAVAKRNPQSDENHNDDDGDLYGRIGSDTKAGQDDGDLYGRNDQKLENSEDDYDLDFHNETGDEKESETALTKNTKRVCPLYCLPMMMIIITITIITIINPALTASAPLHKPSYSTRSTRSTHPHANNPRTLAGAHMDSHQGCVAMLDRPRSHRLIPSPTHLTLSRCHTTTPTSRGHVRHLPYCTNAFGSLLTFSNIS